MTRLPGLARKGVRFCPRHSWEYAGRERNLADDGKSAQRRGAASQEWRGQKRTPLRAKPGKRVTQMHYARQGIITKDNVSVRVNAVVMFEVTDSLKAGWSR